MADTTLDIEAGCGPFLLTMLGVHAKPQLTSPSTWYGTLQFSTSVDKHTLEALVTFTAQKQSATLDGKTGAGTPVQMEILFSSL